MPTARIQRASLIFMMASGFAGLGYQIVWTQQCALWLGHESAAVLAVVAAFFGGLAAGAFMLGARIERSERPGRWYAGCELMIALWSLVLVFAMAPWGASMLELVGERPGPVWQWAVAFSGTFVLLLPATAAMGATLPALVRVTDRLRQEGRSIAGLYAANTFGAVIGVVGVAFWLVPALGFRRTAGVCVGLNLLCAMASLLLFRTVVEPAPIPQKRNASGTRALLARLALTGLLGIGYEVLVVRVLSQVTENTVYTFALLLAVYLVGSAAGAAAHARWLSSRDGDELGDRLLAAASAASLAGGATLWAAGRVNALAREALGNSPGAAIAAEALLAVLAFGPPTIVMGALFSHLGRRAAESGVGFGRALGANTLGAAAAPVLFGVLAVPAIGPKVALVMVGVGYLSLSTMRAWSRPTGWLPAGCALALALLAPPLAFVEVPAGGRVLSYQEGVTAAVSVVEDQGGVARMRINNRQQEGSSATLRVDGRQAWLPLLLHPAPARALFLGLGTGVTAASAALDPSLEVDAVELVPEVIAASALFTPALTALTGGPPPSGLHPILADARRYVRVTERRYDVIVSDNFHPARSGSGSLYTVEHFEAVRRRLASGGLFCQWLPLHQMDLDTLRSIVRSFTIVNPGGWALIASNSLETPVLGLVATAEGGRFDASVIRARIDAALAAFPIDAALAAFPIDAALAASPIDAALAASPIGRETLPRRITELGLEDELAVLGSFVAGPEALRRFAGDTPANTDDLPVVAYRAPRITYAPDTRPGDRLIALLRQVAIAPAQLVVNPPDPAWEDRLAAYWLARNRFVEAGENVRLSLDVQQMLAQVREPLLSVLRISPDFRPAYDPLLSMAIALAQADSSGARTLLAELARLQPARSEAPRRLARMEAADSPLGPQPR